MSDIIITTGSAHLRRVDRASTRRIRKMTQDAISAACRKARDQGATPISAVDDLSVHGMGRWIRAFSKCLARSARREHISIVGGEMAQMRDVYAEHYVGVWVTVVSLRVGEGGGMI